MTIKRITNKEIYSQAIGGDFSNIDKVAETQRSAKRFLFLIVSDCISNDPTEGKWDAREKLMEYIKDSTSLEELNRLKESIIKLTHKLLIDKEKFISFLKKFLWCLLLVNCPPAENSVRKSVKQVVDALNKFHNGHKVKNYIDNFRVCVEAVCEEKF